MIALWITALAWANCDERPLVPEAQGEEVTEGGCAATRLRFGGRMYANSPDIGISRGVSLYDTRGELTVGAPRDVTGRFAFIVAQTGGSAGYLAVAGESWVPVVQIAEARWDWKPTGIALAAGIVDDPWTIHENRIWALRVLAPGLGLGNGWEERADVGSWLAWTSPNRWVSASVAVQSGEGFRRRERNNGVDVAGQVIARPLEGEDTLEVMLYAREGSRGLLSARNHRIGMAVSGGLDPVKFGLQALLGWGLAADGTLTPAGLSVFARTDELPVLAWLRADHARTVRGDASTGTNTFLAGVGPRLPFEGDPKGPAALTLAGEARIPAANAGPTAGQPVNSYTVYLQLSAEVGKSWTDAGAP